MSYTQSIYHIVFRTYRSENTIAEEHERDLYAYILGFCNNHNVKLYRIGGMPDHIHLLIGIPANIALAKIVNELKTSTSIWLKHNPQFPRFSRWSSGYAGLSCSYEAVDQIRHYIASQKEHHHKESFAAELQRILAEQHVEYNETYFLKDKSEDFQPSS